MIPSPRPTPIDLEVPYKNHPGSDHDVPMITELFRADACLNEGLELAFESGFQEGTRVIISAGCSTGPEVDSTLALCAQKGIRGELDITGYDANGLAIRLAKAGRHIVLRAFQNQERVEAQLKGLGFGTEYEVTAGYRKHADAEERLVALAEPVRSGQKVGFIQHDLTEPLPASQAKADLIFVNNVLYHLPPVKIRQVLQNLASSLKSGGILSVGESGVVDPNRQIFAETILRREFGLEPVLRGRMGQPIAFAYA